MPGRRLPFRQLAAEAQAVAAIRAEGMTYQAIGAAAGYFQEELPRSSSSV